MQNSPFTAIVASLALTGGAVNAAAYDGSRLNDPGSKLTNLKLPPAQNLAPALGKLPLECPADRALFQGDKMQGFTQEQAAQLNAAIHLLELAMPDAPWIGKARSMTWKPLPVDSKEFPEIANAPLYRSTPIKHYGRMEDVLFDLQGRRKVEKEYLMVAVPMTEQSTAVLAVCLGSHIAVEFDRRNPAIYARSMAGCRHAQIEISEKVSTLLAGNKVVLDPQTLQKWDSDLRSAHLDGRWQEHRELTKAAVYDCVPPLARISRDRGMLEKEPKLKALIEDTLADIKELESTPTHRDLKLEVPYRIASRFERLAEKFAAVKDDPYLKSLQEKGDALAKVVDEYNSFLVMTVIPIVEARMKAKDKQPPELPAIAPQFQK